MQDRTQIVATLMEYLGEECGLDTSRIEGDTELFAAGLLDSMEIVKLVAFIEEEFSQRVDPLAVSLSDFSTVDRIAEFVAKPR